MFVKYIYITNSKDDFTKNYYSEKIFFLNTNPKIFRILIEPLYFT